jgi:MAP kinase substrate 1
VPLFLHCTVAPLLFFLTVDQRATQCQELQDAVLRYIYSPCIPVQSLACLFAVRQPVPLTSSVSTSTCFRNPVFYYVPIRPSFAAVSFAPIDPMAAASFDAAADVTRRGGTGRALGVHAASHKIGKPPPGAGHGQQERKPVIIYMVSPKVIHVDAHEFMPLVQRLTGPEAGRGDRKSRPSTSGVGGAGEAEPSEGARNKTRAAPPVRVKARALNRPAVSVTTTRRQQAAADASPPSGLMLFQDLSPLRGAALKGEHLPLVSPAWLHHVGDHFLSPAGAAAALGSPSPSFVDDIFGTLSSQQQ